MKPNLNRSFRNSEDFGDGRLRQIVLVPKVDQSTLLQCRPGQRLWPGPLVWWWTPGWGPPPPPLVRDPDGDLAAPLLARPQAERLVARDLGHPWLGRTRSTA